MLKKTMAILMSCASWEQVSPHGQLSALLVRLFGP